MKKTIFILLIILILSGCGLDTNTDSSTINEMDYFNKYIEELNKNSDNFKTLQEYYESNVPVDIKVDDEVNLNAQIKNTTQNDLKSLENNLLNSNLKIDIQNKQTALENMLNEYIALGNKYLTVYDEIENYFNNDEYKQTLDKAATFETDIQTVYYKLVEKEEALYSKINEYQRDSNFKANINTDDPLEKISATIDLFTSDSEEIYTLYMNKWDAASEPVSIEKKYNSMVEQRQDLIDNLNKLDYDDLQARPVKEYFDKNYLIAFDSYLLNFKTMITDYQMGKINKDNIDSYDVLIQADYEKIVSAHNEIIDLTAEALGK